MSKEKHIPFENKSREIVDYIESTFPRYTQRIKTKKCPFCGEGIKVKDFRDKISLKEYTISGLCQKCQDSTFGGKPNES